MSVAITVREVPDDVIAHARTRVESTGVRADAESIRTARDAERR